MFQTIIRSRSTVFAAALLAAVAMWSCGDDDDPTGPEEEDFAATLNGASERPDPVNTTATGTGTIEFTGSGAVAYNVNVAGLSSTPTAAHIHGPSEPTAAAGIIVTLTITPTQNGLLATGSFNTTGVATISLDSLKTLFRNGKAYFNVHTTNFPGGEIRGTIQ